MYQLGGTDQFLRQFDASIQYGVNKTIAHMGKIPKAFTQALGRATSAQISTLTSQTKAIEASFDRMGNRLDTSLRRITRTLLGGFKSIDQVVTKLGSHLGNLQVTGLANQLKFLDTHLTGIEARLAKIKSGGGGGSRGPSSRQAHGSLAAEIARLGLNPAGPDRYSGMNSAGRQLYDRPFDDASGRRYVARLTDGRYSRLRVVSSGLMSPDTLARTNDNVRRLISSLGLTETNNSRRLVGSNASGDVYARTLRSAAGDVFTARYVNDGTGERFLGMRNAQRFSGSQISSAMAQAMAYVDQNRMRVSGERLTTTPDGRTIGTRNYERDAGFFSNARRMSLNLGTGQFTTEIEKGTSTWSKMAHRITGDGNLIQKALHTAFSPLSLAWEGMSRVGNGMLRIAGTIYTLRAAGNALKAAFVDPIRDAVKGVIDVTERFRMFELSISGVAGGRGRAGAISNAINRASFDSPLNIEGFENSFRQMSYITALRRRVATGSPEDVVRQGKDFTNMILKLAQVDPAQGTEGALISTREALSGEFLSLRRRFEIPIGDVAAAGGYQVSDLAGSAGKIEESLRAYLEQIIPDSAIEEQTKLISTRMEKIRDAIRLGAKKIGESGFYDDLSDRIGGIGRQLFDFVESPEFAQRADRVSKSMTRVVGNISKTISNALRGFTDQVSDEGAVDSFSENMTRVIEAVGRMSDTLPTVGDKVSNAIREAFQWAKEAFSEAQVLAKDIRSILDNPASHYASRMLPAVAENNRGHKWEYNPDFQPGGKHHPGILGMQLPLDDGAGTLSVSDLSNTRLSKLAQQASDRAAAPARIAGEKRGQWAGVIAGDLADLTKIIGDYEERVSQFIELNNKANESFNNVLKNDPLGRLLGDYEATAREYRGQPDIAAAVRGEYAAKREQFAGSLVRGARGYALAMSQRIGDQPLGFQANFFGNLQSGDYTHANAARDYLSNHGIDVQRRRFGLFAMPIDQQSRVFSQATSANLSYIEQYGGFGGRPIGPAGDIVARARRPLSERQVGRDQIAYLEQQQSVAQEVLFHAENEYGKNPSSDRAAAAWYGAAEQLAQVSSQLERLRDRVNPVREAFQQLGLDVRNAFEEGIGSAIEGLILGTHSVEDAFKNMGRSILSSFAQVQGRIIAQGLFGDFGTPAQGGGTTMNVGGLVGGFMGLFGGGGAGAGVASGVTAARAKDGAIFAGGFTPVHAFADGGIVKGGRGVIGLIGEGGPGADEAVIPLRGGKVPVHLTGRGGYASGGEAQPVVNVYNVADYAEAVSAGFDRKRGDILNMVRADNAPGQRGRKILGKRN